MRDNATPPASPAGTVFATARANEEELQRRLDEIRARHPSVDPDAVAAVVRAVLVTMSGDLTAQETSLLAEVEELGRTIADARAEIAALQVDDITDSHIPTATDELDAVVQHTAIATDRILEVCETLDTVAGKLADAVDADALRQATTTIYEACSFQDITGQRISKVIAALKTIDAKVATIVASFGQRRRAPDLFRALTHSAPPPEALLHGPQLPAAAMGQSAIDALLASFE